jgi:hypothetical protein
VAAAAPGPRAPKNTTRGRSGGARTAHLGQHDLLVVVLVVDRAQRRAAVVAREQRVELVAARPARELLALEIVACWWGEEGGRGAGVSGCAWKARLLPLRAGLPPLCPCLPPHDPAFALAPVPSLTPCPPQRRTNVVLRLVPLQRHVADGVAVGSLVLGGVAAGVGRALLRCRAAAAAAAARGHAAAAVGRAAARAGGGRDGASAGRG